MRVVIVTSTAPFVHGGATLIVDWLEEELRRRGHEVDTFRLPVESAERTLAVESVGMRLHDLTGHGDRLIALRTPSYLVRHHHKVAWFLHHHRPAYDLWDLYPDVARDADGWEFRRMLHAADEVGLGECRRVFSNSRRTADRLRDHNGVEAEVLYPPVGTGPAAMLQATTRPEPSVSRDSLVCVSRVVPHKRQLLAIEAMARTRSAVRLVLAGTGDPAYREQLFRTIDRLGLVGRVTFLDTVVREQTKAELVRDSLGVVYLPQDEDSYGYTALEAAVAGRPVVTTTDSGGVLELVTDGVNGFVVAPEPEALARRFDDLFQQRALAEELGAGQAGRIKALGIDWDTVVERLLS